MNIQYLRYALEIAKTKSINKASENLYISQPNLSRAIKKLEEEAGIKIFSRSSRGIELTIAGDEFLAHAQNVIEEIDKMERLNDLKDEVQKFSIVVPRASYISHAFSDFASGLSIDKKMLVDYKETSSIGAIYELGSGSFDLGIVRYPVSYEQYFDLVFKDYGLIKKKICSFTYVVAFAKDDPLSKKETISKEDLKDYIEILHGDPYIPNIDNKVKNNEPASFDKRVRVYDSMGQLAMLNKIPHTFMVTYPLDKETLEKNHLTQRFVSPLSEDCVDVLIYREKYRFTKLDQKFVSILEKSVGNQI